MAEWIGIVTQVFEGSSADVTLELNTYVLGVDEDGPPPKHKDAPLPRVGQTFRLVPDEYEQPF